MKKTRGSRTKRLLQNKIRARSWSDWDRLNKGAFFIVDAAKRALKMNPSIATESFEEAQQKLKLTDEDLSVRARFLYRLSLVMLGLSIGLFGYSIYLFIFGTIHAGILGLVLSFLSLVFTFRYHFWYFQIKQHKLGCSFKEWFHKGLMGDQS